MNSKPSTILPFSVLPEGTVTFLFTDIEGSTKLLKRLRETYARVLKEQRMILQEAFSKHGGHMVDTRGEEFFVAFQRATESVAAAVQAQRELAKHEWPEDIQLRVRMGIHTGEPWVREEGYIGMDVHRAARIANLGHGGQVLLSETTTALVIDDLPEGVNLEDLGRHRMKDVPRMEKIHQLVIDGLRHAYPPLKSLEAEVPEADRAPNHNLPAELTPFIGREDELATILSMLGDPSCRLVTLLGVGGMGKTRLALRAAGELLDRFPDGVWLVEFAKLRDAELVPQHTAAVFGVNAQQAEEGRSVSDVLVNFLRDRNLLLVLDNCEHLIKTCAEFAEMLLKQCPRIKILATSRENFGIASEHTFIVPAMEIPDETLSLEDIKAFEAMLFFEDRARAAVPMFNINPQNIDPIVEICRRLDGIPLAIELAAARIKILSPDQIAMLLHDRFRLLRGGPRTALVRHQALQATLEWSYNLLTEPEQHLFTRLAVFAGGWTLEAVEGLLTGDIDGELTVLELLSSLVDKSLVMVSHNNSTTRYGMLETVQQYASELLEASGQEAEYRHRHAEYFITLAEQADPELRGANQIIWLNTLDDERENLRAALRWLTAADQANDAARLVAALGWYWFMRGDWVEAWHWVTTILDLPTDPEPIVRAKAICRAGGLQLIQGNMAGPPDLIREALAIFTEYDEQEGLAWCSNLMGQLATYKQIDSGTGIQYLNQSIEHFQHLDDEWGVAWSNRYLGQLAEIEGDVERALTLQEWALQGFKKIGDYWNATHSQYLIGGTLRDSGQYEQSENAYRKSLEMCQEIQNDVMEAHALQGLGFIAFEYGRYREAEAHLRDALEVMKRIGDDNCSARGYYFLARIAQQDHDYRLGIEYLRESIKIYKKLNREGNMAACLALYGEIEGIQGHFYQAAKLLGAASNLSSRSPDHQFSILLKELDIQVQRIQEQMKESEFKRAYAEGYAMTVDQVVAYALGTLTQTL